MPISANRALFAKMRTALLVVLALNLFNVTTFSQAPRPISLVVVDPQGEAVPNATVRLELRGRSVWEGRTSLDGTLELNTDVADVVLTVTAPDSHRPRWLWKPTKTAGSKSR